MANLAQIVLATNDVFLAKAGIQFSVAVAGGFWTTFPSFKV
jgi:hypothetical protein